MVEAVGAAAGFDGEVHTTLPVGSGLSSSAALRVLAGGARAARLRGRRPWSWHGAAGTPRSGPRACLPG
ncbi:MAG: hypothetical protein U5R31_12920 [Acidimicrobiia bacterium]|nr:hypothetical protein [Acidimicrobiia bacterium]